MKKKVTAATRLTTGGNAVSDKGGNTQKTAGALETLVAGGEEAGGMNAAEGAMRLQAIMQGEEVNTDKAKKLKTEFAEEENKELIAILRKEPAERTDEDVKLVEKHVAWHPIFANIKPLLRRKMFRFLRARAFKYGQVICLQGPARRPRLRVVRRYVLDARRGEAVPKFARHRTRAQATRPSRS